jgi:phosphoserine phosphatase
MLTAVSIPTFHVGTGPDEVVSSVASQTNGDVLISGSFSFVNGLYQPNMARLRVDGSLGRRDIEPYEGKQPGKPLLYEDKQKELKSILDKMAEYAG